MRRLKRWALVGLLFLLGLEILTLAPKRLAGPEEVAKVKTKKETEQIRSQVATTQQVMGGAHAVETSQGERAWELDAQQALGLKDKGNWQLTGVRVKFFGKNDAVYDTTGDTGFVEVTTKNMEIKGHVVTKSNDGYTFNTDYVIYSAGNRHLTAPHHVSIVGPGSIGRFELEGRGLKIDMNTSQMTLDSEVRAQRTVADSKMMNIRSRKLNLNGKSNDARFSGAVQVDMGSVRMTGDRADFVYEDKTHVLKSLLVEGNVKVTDESRWASSDRAQILFAENEFVLSGNPRVVQNESELRGTEIRLLNGGKDMRVIKANANLKNDPSALKGESRGAVK